MVRTRYICTEILQPVGDYDEGWKVCFKVAGDYADQNPFFDQELLEAGIVDAELRGLTQAGADQFEVGRTYWLDFISIGENE